MSTQGNLAIARPLRRPAPSPEPRRHLEIAPSRAQRRARPRLAHAVVTVAGIGAILLVQLLISFALADGAYQISSLQTQQRDLVREQEALSERLEVLGSTQNLTANAEALGMVVSGNPLFLDLTTGGIIGSGSTASTLPANLVKNSLLDGSTIIDPRAIAAALVAESTSRDRGTPAFEGVPTSATSPPSSPNPGTLPSPTTR